MVSGGSSRGRVGSSTAASDSPVSNALIRVTRLHVMRVRQLLHGLGLHPGHELLLMRLWDSGPQRQTALAAEFDTDSASMTRTVQRLERAGFLRRRPDPNDGRATLVEPTPAGMALRSRIEELWGELERDTVNDMPAAQRRQVLRGLQSLEANLSAATAGDTTLAPRDAGPVVGPTEHSRGLATSDS
ncbi:MAG: Transcriptional regulator [Mycobacterium sp.]|nr:Transcriptional regulator [Mycobacterium sp.]